ncbi:MAG TPA: glycosyl hydrolase family 17 protein [Gemmataceae bacterium]|jgi:exo-beta-1,3-glucanase (GH17 family)|nr:glycosyl hydrolase family 17 protein [Gemmataceae bacterium]
MPLARLRLEPLERRDNPSYKLPAIDFSPYILAGENPNNGSGQISQATLTARLTAMAPYADAIRTFDCTGDLQPAAQIIRSLGKTCMIGAWLQDDNPANQAAIDAANDAAVAELIAQAHAGNVDMAIIGSETLQRGKFSEAKLLAYINQVKTDFANNSLAIPVTTADTYPALLQHPAILAAVDRVYANFYPFWEHEPVESAVAKLNQEYHTLQQLVPSKLVFVSETGWPSGGSAQGAAIPSPTNAAYYALDAVSWARANNIPFAYFEAIDEPFKVIQEGDVGPHWGMFNSDLTLKPGMDAIFNGDILPDNWSAIDFASMPGQMTTNIANFVLSGSTAPGNVVEVNGVAIPASEIDSGGAYAHMIPLAVGVNNLTVTIRNSGGTLLQTINKTVTLDLNYSTAQRGLLYVDAVSAALNGTIVIDPAARQILGIIAFEHIRGVSADGREIYMHDGSVRSHSTHQFVRSLPFTQPIDSNSFIVSPTGDNLYSHTEVVAVGTNALLAPLPMDITTGTSYNSAPIPGGPTISSDGATIYAGNPIVSIDVVSHVMTPTGITAPGYSSDIGISPDNQWIVTSSYAGGGRVDIFNAATYQPAGTVTFGDFAGKIQFLGGNRAVVGNAGNPANGGGSVTVFDLSTASAIQSSPIMLADNVSASGNGSDVFVATGDGLGIVDRGVAADGTLRQATTFNLGINRYVQGSGIPANDEIRGLYFAAAPVVSIDRTTPLGPLTNLNSVVYTVTFGKNVTGVDATDFSLALNGVSANSPVVVSGGGSVYTVTVNGISGDGTLGLNLDDNDTIIDPSRVPIGGFGTGNGDFTGQVYTIDTVGPAVTINKAAAQQDPTNSSPITFDVHFSEPVSGFTASDVDLTASTVGGPLVASVSGSGADYSIIVTGMSGVGNVIASIHAATVLDMAGNSNAASTSTDNSVGFGFVIPDVTINRGATQADPTSILPIKFDVVFSEPVDDTTFTVGDIDLSSSTADVTGATVTITRITSSTFTVSVNGVATRGAVTATIPAGKVSDAVGNLNTASTSTDNTVAFLHAGVISFTASTQNTAEGATITVVASRTVDSEGVVSVDYNTIVGTAHASDLAAAPGFTLVGTLTWGDGDTADKSFNIQIVDDAANEGKEVFTVGMSNPVGGVLIGATSTETIAIAPSDGKIINSAAVKPAKPLFVFTDSDNDLVTVSLAGKLGTATVYLTDPDGDGKGPLELIQLAGTDVSKSTLTISSKKPKGGAGDGRAMLAEVTGTSLKSLTAKTTDLNGPGITMSGFLGKLLIGNIGGGADITINGSVPAKPKNASVKITAGVIGDGTDILIPNAPLGNLTAISVGSGGMIVTPYAGSIKTIGSKKAGNLGDFRSNITITGVGVSAKTLALKTLKVLGGAFGITVKVASGTGTVGDVGSVSVGSFDNSRLFAGYSGPDDGSGSFNLGSTIGSFTVTSKSGDFGHSNVIADKIGNVMLSSVNQVNGGVKFGFLYHSLLKSLLVKSPAFKFDPHGLDEQNPFGDFDVKKV